MKKLVGLVVVAVVVVGIVKVVGARSPEGKARTACENLASQCESLTNLGGGKKLADSDIDDCAKGLAEAKDKLGEDYNNVVSCIADADSCGESLGCLTGVVANELEDQLEGFKRGFDRTRN